MNFSDNSLSAAEEAELFQLVWSIRDDHVTVEQLVRLEQLVQTRRAARRIYVDLVNLLADLRWQVAPSVKSSTWSDAVQEPTWESPEELARLEKANQQSAIKNQKPKSPVL